MSKNLNSKDYKQSLELIQTDILQTQLKAALVVTEELIMLYWRIGKLISEKINTAKWGTKVITTLAHDLKKILPGATGFSLRNLH